MEREGRGRKGKNFGRRERDSEDADIFSSSSTKHTHMKSAGYGYCLRDSWKLVWSVAPFCSQKWNFSISWRSVQWVLKTCKEPLLRTCHSTSENNVEKGGNHVNRGPLWTCSLWVLGRGDQVDQDANGAVHEKYDKQSQSLTSRNSIITSSNPLCSYLLKVRVTFAEHAAEGSVKRSCETKWRMHSAVVKPVADTKGYRHTNPAPSGTNRTHRSAWAQMMSAAPSLRSFYNYTTCVQKTERENNSVYVLVCVMMCLHVVILYIP